MQKLNHDGNTWDLSLSEVEILFIPVCLSFVLLSQWFRSVLLFIELTVRHYNAQVVSTVHRDAYTLLQALPSFGYIRPNGKKDVKFTVEDPYNVEPAKSKKYRFEIGTKFKREADDEEFDVSVVCVCVCVCMCVLLVSIIEWL